MTCTISDTTLPIYIKAEKLRKLANAGRRLGLKEVDEDIWLVSFMHYDLGNVDLEQNTLQTIDNPFGSRLSPMPQVRSVTHVSGPDTGDRW